MNTYVCEWNLRFFFIFAIDYILHIIVAWDSSFHADSDSDFDYDYAYA